MKPNQTFIKLRFTSCKCLVETKPDIHKISKEFKQVKNSVIMVEFNPDGSIKLPERFAKIKAENESKMQNQRCIKVKKEIVNFDAPKKCVLNIVLSQAISDNRFVENIYNFFRNGCSVPTKFIKINEKEFSVEIGTDFRRCSDCCSLISKYRDFLDGNLIEEKVNCTYERRTQNFSYEDYFD